MIKIIEAEELLVDKVTLNVIGFRIQKINFSQYNLICSELEKRFFSILSNSVTTKKYRFRKDNKISGEGSFYYNNNSQNANLKFSFTFNPTKLLRFKLEVEDDISLMKKSNDGGLNFIPDSLKGAEENHSIRNEIFERFFKMVNDLIDELVGVINRCLNDTKADLTNLQISIEDIELYKDIYMKDSILFIHENSDLFRAHFQKSNARIYTPKHFDLTTDRNSIGLRCQLQAKTSIHIYSKLENSLRIEITFKKARIQKTIGTNRINDWSSKFLMQLCSKLSEESVRKVNEFLLNLTLKDLTSELENLLYQIARRCSSFDKFMFTLNQLMIKGSIKADKPNSYQVYALRNCGILKKSNSGLYSLSSNDFSELKRFYKYLNQNTNENTNGIN